MKSAFGIELAPMPAVVIPIADRHVEYAEKLRSELAGADVRTATFGLRVTVDASSERMQKKIRNAQAMKVPYMLVVGDREAETRTASVRLRGGRDLGAMGIGALVERMRGEVASRRDVVGEVA